MAAMMRAHLVSNVVMGVLTPARDGNDRAASYDLDAQDATRQLRR